MAIVKVEINTIIASLTEASRVFSAYEQGKKNILRDFRDRALEEGLKKLEAQTKASITPHAWKIEEALDSMIEKTEKGNDYNVNSDAVANAAKLLSVPGISYESAANVVEKFKGNQVALELINASAHESYQPILAQWIFDAVGELKKAKNLVSQFSYESASNYPDIILGIKDSIVKYARHQGIELGDFTGPLEELRVRNIASMIGLDPDEIF